MNQSKPELGQTKSQPKEAVQIETNKSTMTRGKRKKKKEQIYGPHRRTRGMFVRYFCVWCALCDRGTASLAATNH